ncbi:MAG: PsbP-related protein [Candidatus Omnitrophota bacterium]
MKEKKLQNFLFGALITVALVVIVMVILSQIKIIPTKEYHDEQFKFTVKYPAYWPIVVRPQNGMALVQFSSPKSSEDDKVIENVNISIVDLALNPKMMDINYFSKITTQQMIGTFGEGLNVLETKSARWSGLPAFRFSYVTKEKTSITGSRMKYLHVWTIKGQYAFILTYIGEAEEFDENMKRANIIIKSFKFDS